MVLTLEVVSPQGASLGPARRCTFRADGGTIGRQPDCDWVLPDPCVSRRHALISCRNGTFYIEDTSSSGLSINSPTNRLARGQPHALQPGDCILIEPYEVRVSMTSELDDARAWPSNAHEAAVAHARFDRPDALEPDDPFAHREPRSPGEPSEGQELDPLRLLGTPPPQAGPSNQRSLEPARPSPISGPPAIPPDYNPLEDFVEPSTPVAPVPNVDAPPATPAGDISSPPLVREVAIPEPEHEPPAVTDSQSGAPDWAAVLAGAGLDPSAVTPELARNLGQILRVVVSGVMDVLRARHEVKGEFQMRLTYLRPAENNPLKFSANVDDALDRLLVKRNPAYLGPVEAFDDAFQDVRHHEVAMLAGMRVAFESMLAEFAPDRLQEDFDRQLKHGWLFGPMAKLRYWDLYRDHCQQMARDPDKSFRQLFVEEFSRAYEEQLARLKAENGARARSKGEPQHPKI